MKELKPYEEYIKKSLYLEEHLKRKYPTEKKYLESFKQFSTYAVLTPKGEWYEAGSMGWWGISSATPEQEAKFKKIIKKISLKQQIQNGN
ncbi:MAG: hypothetical protein HFJ26_01715 [Clostridia bacterium]|nr:hypothetical protein [Clostridia bacterium]